MPAVITPRGAIQRGSSGTPSLRSPGLLPVFDMAYQGFGEDIESDAYPVRLFAQEHETLLLCTSFSKNFGLYGERVGLLSIRAPDPDCAKRALSQVKVVIRGLYSNPPCHGAQIVRTILNHPDLHSEWEAELAKMRLRIIEMREALVDGLMARSEQIDFDFMRSQKGMFSFTGLRPEQVARLREDYGIYMPPSGRVNIAGLNPSNLDYVIDSLLSVMR